MKSWKKKNLTEEFGVANIRISEEDQRINSGSKIVISTNQMSKMILKIGNWVFRIL